jgi:hypothetical protein
MWVKFAATPGTEAASPLESAKQNIFGVDVLDFLGWRQLQCRHTGWIAVCATNGAFVRQEPRLGHADRHHVDVTRHELGLRDCRRDLALALSLSLIFGIAMYQ